MECPKCRAVNPGTKSFCPDCGTPLPPPTGGSANATETLPPPVRASTPEGTFAGRYQIIEELGRGGMGIVYKARDAKLDRTVALKFLPPEWTFESQAKERFVREARAAAALDHPHICPVYEIDEADGRMFISMAFVEGETLQKRIERGLPKIKEALDIGIQVADGLREAHLKGIVHRDIKSSNIMISDQGRAKILDFGLAKVRGGALVTKEGATMGTVAFMSPEQARGEKVDHRTDIWSFGVVLFEMLSGELPFQGDHDQTVIHAILGRKPAPLRKLRPGVPEALERIVARALEKKRDDRFQSADDLLEELRRAGAGLEAASREEGLSRLQRLFKRRVPQILGIYVLASLGVLQLVRWLASRFVLSPHLPDFCLAALLSFVPTVLLLAYFHGAPGRRTWAKREKIGIAANLAASAALLLLLFSGKSLGAATTTVTLTNEDGGTVDRVIPKGEFRKSLALFFFENKTKDPARDWLRYGLPRLLELDLAQDLFIDTHLGYDFIDTVRAAGFQDGTGLPMTLMNKIAKDKHLKYFVAGSFSDAGEDLVLETSIHETGRMAEIARSEFRDRDIFSLIDLASLGIRRGLGVPEQHIRSQNDLPVSETVTASLPAFESYMKGINAMVFDRSWDRALEDFERSAAEDPTFAHAHFEVQQLAAYSNQREKREGAFQSLMRNLYKLPERQQYLVKSAYYAFKGDREKQIAVLKMMAELSPDDGAGRGELANLYLAADRPDDALAELKSILEIDPGQKDVLLAIGSTYQQLGKPEDALKYYDRYAAQFPGDMKLFALMGDLHRGRGDFERAKSSYEKALLIEPENVAALIAMARVESALGNFEASERIHEDALKRAQNPQDKVSVYDSLASVFTAQGRYRRSLEAVRLIFEEWRKSRPPFLALLSEIGYLDTFVRGGRKDEAFRIVEEIRAQAAPPIDALVPLAELIVHVAAEDAAKAAAALAAVESAQSSSVLQDNRPAILFYRGRVLEMKGEFEEALAAFHKYAEIKPAERIAAIGRCYRKLKEFKKAEAHLRECLKTSPFDPDIHYELSLVYVDTGDTKKARDHLRTAVDIWKNADPGIPEVEDARKRLAALN